MSDKQQPDEPDPGELLEKLTRADGKNLSGAVKKVDGLTEEEKAVSKRAQDDKLSKNWQVILQCMQWAFGAAIAALILVLAASLIWLLFTHVKTIIELPEKVAAALSFCFQTLLIVLATAFIDRLLLNRDRSRR